MNDLNTVRHSIGTASIDEFGTLTLDLHRNFETRLGFHQILTIYRDNPRYNKYIDYIGGVRFGEKVQVLLH